MAEFQVDSDWKKQAAEEKKRLAEEEQKRAAAASAPAAKPAGGDSSATTPRTGRSVRELGGTFAGLVQSVMTQVLYYLGDLAPRGSEPNVNLDLAKHHLDTLAMLEEKTKGNLTPDEIRVLDAALYETRMRFVGVSQQYIQ